MKVASQPDGSPRGGDGRRVSRRQKAWSCSSAARLAGTNLPNTFRLLPSPPSCRLFASSSRSVVERHSASPRAEANEGRKWLHVIYQITIHCFSITAGPALGITRGYRGSPGVIGGVLGFNHSHPLKCHQSLPSSLKCMCSGWGREAETLQTRQQERLGIKPTTFLLSYSVVLLSRFQRLLVNREIF